MERYLGGEDDRPVGADRRPGEGRRARLVLPGHPGVQRAPASARCELLEVATSGFPSPLEHPLPEVFTPAGRARTPAWPATRTGRCSPRW